MLDNREADEPFGLFGPSLGRGRKGGRRGSEVSLGQGGEGLLRRLRRMRRHGCVLEEQRVDTVRVTDEDTLRRVDALVEVE